MYELTFTDPVHHIDLVGTATEQSLVTILNYMLKTGIMLSGIEYIPADDN